jgi:hypothetical protein
MSASTGALINAAIVARLAIPAIKLTFFIELPSDDRSLSHYGRPAPALYQAIAMPYAHVSCSTNHLQGV